MTTAEQRQAWLDRGFDVASLSDRQIAYAIEWLADRVAQHCDTIPDHAIREAIEAARHQPNLA